MALFNREDKSARLAPSAGAVAQPSIAPIASERSGATRLVGVEGRALLDKGTKISGKLSFEGPARIDGQVDGEIKAKDSIIIGQSGVVVAQITTNSISIEGKVNGDIVASQRIEIHSTARVQGNISAPVLLIQEGAFFEGHCGMQPEVVREERKVTVFPMDKEERVAQLGGQKQL
jgi:cytoskeletal protein CcmA (bactofilin family)